MNAFCRFTWQIFMPISVGMKTFWCTKNILMILVALACAVALQLSMPFWICTYLQLSAKLSKPTVVTPKVVNVIGMQFVPVPGTSVLFSIWETRVRDYEDFVCSTGRPWKRPDFKQDLTHPAVNMTLEDAKAFCDWLTLRERLEGKLRGDDCYRLPTDREWSAAAGLRWEVGKTPQMRDSNIRGVYPWGTQWPPPRGAGNYDSSLKVDDYPQTSPVGSFPPNRYGLYDIGGNAWEWVDDEFAPGSQTAVLRGAPFYGMVRGRELSLSRRDQQPPNLISGLIGFRCVLQKRTTME